MSAFPKPSNTDIERHANKLKAIELRHQRKNYREIAAELGVAVGTAYKYIKDHCAELKACGTETAEEMMQLDLATLDAWLEVIDKRIKAGAENPLYDVEKAVNAGCKVMERRHKLTGADAATKVDVKHTEAIEPTDDLPTVKAKLEAALADVNSQLNERTH